MSASTPHRPVLVRAFLLAVLALVLSAAAAAWRARREDDLAGAWWIGRFEVARLGRPATLAFGARVPPGEAAAGATLRFQTAGSWEAFFDGRSVASGGGAEASTTCRLPGPIAAGEHDLAVVVSHPEGAASLRLRLDFEGARRREVVTGPGWRVDDDATGKRMGFGELRYPATLWARPPLSVFSMSSSTRSSSGRAAVSTAPDSSRIPSRAATE